MDFAAAAFSSIFQKYQKSYFSKYLLATTTLRSYLQAFFYQRAEFFSIFSVTNELHRPGNYHAMSRYVWKQFILVVAKLEQQNFKNFQQTGR